MTGLALVAMAAAFATAVALAVAISWKHFDLLRQENARLRVEVANANERTRFAEDQRDQWAAAFPVEHDARRRLWRCRTHVYGGIR